MFMTKKSAKVVVPALSISTHSSRVGPTDLCLQLRKAYQQHNVVSPSVAHFTCFPPFSRVWRRGKIGHDMTEGFELICWIVSVEQINCTTGLIATSFYVRPLRFPLISIILDDSHQHVPCREALTYHVHPFPKFVALQNLGALSYHAIRIRKQGEPDRDDLVPYLGQHSLESIRDTLVSFDVYVRFVLPFDMLWIEGLVDDRAWDAIRKS